MKESFKVLYLTNNENGLVLYKWIKERCNTILYSEPLEMRWLEEQSPDLLVSYNYRYIIKQDVISYMNGKIINLHISYLPWNRGSSPNIWSFIDGTPKGVTIHQIDKGLDTGDILYQQECKLDIQEETLETSYLKLGQMIVKLFQEHWNEIREGRYVPYKQQGKGSYHTSSDLEKLRERCPFEWDDRVVDFLERYQKSNEEIR